MAPRSGVLYACDLKWWESASGQRAIREFPGLKITQDARAADRYGLRRVALDSADHEISMLPGRIGSGGNGGFQALNLALQFGASKIILLGFDMRVDRGLHWHGQHGRGMNNPTIEAIPKWIAHFERNAPRIEEMGIEVINATPGSALTCFIQKPLDRAIR